MDSGDPRPVAELFYSTDADIEYLSRIIYDWLVANGRMDSRTYLVGESCGGFRGPRITEYLQIRLGVAMNGVVLVSPYLDPSAWSNEFVSPLPWMTTLPSIAAAHLEREGRLTDEAMAEVIKLWHEDEDADEGSVEQLRKAARCRSVQAVGRFMRVGRFKRRSCGTDDGPAGDCLARMLSDFVRCRLRPSGP